MPRRYRLREGLIAGPDPDQPDRYLIFCTQTGEHYEMPRYGWQLAKACDGATSIEALSAQAPQLIGAPIDVDVLQDFLQGLETMSLLTLAPAPEREGLIDEGPQWTVGPVPGDYSLRVDPNARYECVCAGTCCESGYVITLTAAEVQEVRAIGRDDALVLLPTRPERPWTWALSNEWTCPFLSQERRCSIHNSAAHPATCRIFPLAFVQLENEIYASLTHRCVCGAFGEGPPLDPARLRTQISALRSIPQLPQRSRVDDRIELPTQAIVLRWARIAMTETDPWRMLSRAISSLEMLAPREKARSPKKETKLLEKLRSTAFDETDLALRAALLGSPHPNRETILEDMAKAGLKGSDASAEAARFVRDCLFGLRLFRFSRLSDGLLALALALSAALRERADPQRARLAIMLWEEALLSPGLRALMGRRGPLRAQRESLATVRAQVRALSGL